MDSAQKNNQVNNPTPTTGSSAGQPISPPSVSPLPPPINPLSTPPDLPLYNGIGQPPSNPTVSNQTPPPSIPFSPQVPMENSLINTPPRADLTKQVTPSSPTWQTTNNQQPTIISSPVAPTPPMVNDQSPSVIPPPALPSIPAPDPQIFTSMKKNIPPTQKLLLQENFDKNQNQSVTSSQRKKFPFMIVTLITIISTVGFCFSFFFFKNNSQISTVKIPAKITPPLSKTAKLTITPTIEIANTNPFASPSATFENPFNEAVANYENPFGTYENPFIEATKSADLADQPYQNPFEGME